MMSLRGPYNAYTGHEPWKYEPRFTQEQVGERPLLLLLRKIPQYSFSHFLIHHCYQREASLLIAVARLLPRLNPANCLDLDRLLDCPPFIRVEAVSCYYSRGTCGYHKLGNVSSSYFCRRFRVLYTSKQASRGLRSQCWLTVLRQIFKDRKGIHLRSLGGSQSRKARDNPRRENVSMPRTPGHELFLIPQALLRCLYSSAFTDALKQCMYVCRGQLALRMSVIYPKAATKLLNPNVIRSRQKGMIEL